MFDNNNKKNRNSLTNRDNTIKIFNNIINNFKNNFDGKISPRILVSLYYSYMVLEKYEIFIKDLWKFGFRNNLNISLYIFLILMKRLINIFIFNCKKNNQNIKKFLLKDYKLFR